MAKNKPLTELESKAWEYAKLKHEGQTRKFSGLPYFEAHVLKVNDTFKKYCTDEVYVVASILHDVIEDCFNGDLWAGYTEIKKEFGDDVAYVVWMMTSNKEEIEHLFNGSKTNYLIDKLLKMYHSDERIIILKLCDRLKNLEMIFSECAKFRYKYYYETIELLNSIYRNHKKRSHRYNLILETLQHKLTNVRVLFAKELF